MSQLRSFAQILGVEVGDLLGDAELEIGNVPDRTDGRSVFVSYGGPDEGFTRIIANDLSAAGIRTFFFPNDARFGERLHRTMSRGVRTHDFVVLVCSERSLDRPGVLNEIEQALQREAEKGGEEVIIPITLDDYVFTDWAPARADLADQIRARVIADFRGVAPGTPEYDAQFKRLLNSMSV